MKPVYLGVLFVLAVLATLIYTSFGNRRFRCEVCMSYQGQKACRKARAATRETAMQSALSNACAQIASGVTATMACSSSTPDSVRWLQ